MATRFDTLRTFTAIKAAGVDEPAAQAITTAIQDSILDVRDQLATKADVDSLRTSTKGDIDALRLSTKADVDALRLATAGDIENLRVTLTGLIDTRIAEVGKEIAGVGTTVEKAQSATQRWFIATSIALAALILANSDNAARLFGRIFGH